MFFEEIPGNKSIKEELIFSVKKNRIAHSQIFSGNSGSAKLALALAYSRYINCKNPSEKDSCSQCSSCIKYSALSHPDLHFVFPVIKSSKPSESISDNFVKKWREFVLQNSYASLSQWINLFEKEKKINEQGFIYTEELIQIHKKVALKNFEAKFRVFLIWMPEKMALQTSNRFLKLLEEPPSGTIFLLVSENPNQLLPTISSRLQKTKVSDFSVQDAVLFFKNKNIENVEELARKTNVDFGKMIQLIEQGSDKDNFFDLFSSWMRFIYKVDIVNISRWTDSISTAGRSNQNLFLSYTLKMIRECLIFNYANNSMLKINENEFRFISNFSKFIHEENSIMIVEELEKNIKLISRNANAKILFFELSLQMVKFLKIKSKHTH